MAPMPLAPDSLPLCETAAAVVELIFIDSSIGVYDSSHRHLMKCWLNRHFVPNNNSHPICLETFVNSLSSWIVAALTKDNFDAKWHLRFVNGYQLLSECDSSIRCLLGSANFVKHVVDYFTFTINKFIIDASNSSTSGSGNSSSGGGLVYLEAKLLLKLVQTFSRIFGKIQNNRLVDVPALFTDALWIVAASDLYELDMRQASINLIVQLQLAPRYNSFKEKSKKLVDEKVPEERRFLSLLCLKILGAGAFCSQLSVENLAVDETNDGRVLLFVLLEDIAMCCMPRMSTSFTIAFYRSLNSWTKAAVESCALKWNGIWNENNISPVFKLFVNLIESGWDSHAEVVRDLVSETFESLLTLFRNTSDIAGGQDDFLKDLVCTLLQTDWQSRLKYRPLSQITEMFGPTILFQSAAKVGVNIPEKISSAFSDRAIAPHASHFISAIVKSTDAHSKAQFDERRFILELIDAVVNYATEDESVTRHFVTFAVQKLLKARGSRFVGIIVDKAERNCDMLTEAEYLILFSVCRLARASGLYELENDECHDPNSKMSKLLNAALNHSNIHIRLESFGFLCENVRVGQPLWSWELDTIERFVYAAFKVDSSDFRQSYGSLYRKFLNRLRDGGNGAERVLRNSQLATTYAEFLDRCIGLCLESISFQGAAFSRRSTALTLLNLITKVFSTDCTWFSYMEACFVKRPALQILLRALMRDTYEDNKRLAFDLLSVFWEKADRSVINKDDVLTEAMRLAQSTHPQNGATAAYLFKLLAIRFHDNGAKIVEFIAETLLISLREQLEVAKVDLAKAAKSRPIYPTVICIRYVIAEFRSVLIKYPAEFRKFALELITTLREVSDAVSPIITHQSPEGLTTKNVDETEIGEEDDDEDDDPLGLLPEFLTVCCWRSIKEVSLILSLLVEIAVDLSSEKDEMKLLNLEEIQAIGSYFSEMLLKARHRGAFEIAYAGFDHICSKLWRSNAPSLNSLPASWLKPLTQYFEAMGDNVSLSSTRRSAGLPFYFQAVVGNEPRLTRSISISLLETVLNLLIQRALHPNSENEMVRIHALNILRALIRDSRLDQAVAPYLGDAFIASMTALSSKNWSIRNSGTLLFSALMNRVFGVHRERFSPAKKNTMTGRLFFALYPNLFQYLLNYFLDAEANATSSVAVTFLSLFEHLYPSPYDTNEKSLDNVEETRSEETKQAAPVNVFAFIPALVSLLGHRSIRVRIMSSRSIRNFVTVDSLPRLLESLLNRFNAINLESWNSNFVDGCFILLCELVPMFANDVEYFQLIADITFSLIEALQCKNEFVEAGMMQLLLKLVESAPNNLVNHSELVSKSCALSSSVIMRNKGPSTLLIRATQCSILALSKGCLSATMASALENYLDHPNRYVRSATIDTLNSILLSQFLKRQNIDRVLMSSLFDDHLGKDEEYIPVKFSCDHLDLTGSKLLDITWRQLKDIDVARHEFEASKLMTLFSFCILVKSGHMDEHMAKIAFDKTLKILAVFGFMSDLSMPCVRVLAAVAPYLQALNHAEIVGILSKIVSGSVDDSSKFRASIFGLSCLPRQSVLMSDLACDTMITLLTSAEPDIRILASWYVTRKLCNTHEIALTSLHSGEALILFIWLVAKCRHVRDSAVWLLRTATTPRRQLTTESVDNFELVFEAEETNPFAEDRLVSNICIFVLSLLLNGSDITLGKLFPRLRLPLPLIGCLSNDVPSNENLAVEILSFLVENPPNSVLSREKVSESITKWVGKIEKLSDAEFSATMKHAFPQQAAMPRSDVIYQRILVAKVMNPIDEDNCFVSTNRDLKSDAFLVGDTVQIKLLLLC